jgi:DNA-binding LacI/PurR family transcriptional regulator
MGHREIGGIMLAAERGSLARALDDASGSAVHSVERDTIDDGRAAAHDLFGAWPQCTALICGTERIGLGVVQAAALHDLCIPDALSVVTLSGTWLADAAAPPLTTVAVPADALGERAAQVLLDQLGGGERPPSQVFPLVPVVTPRASVAPPDEIPRGHTRTGL